MPCSTDFGRKTMTKITKIVEVKFSIRAATQRSRPIFGWKMAVWDGLHLRELNARMVKG